ncbi:ATP-binding protein [uncultured Pelagimonas sp.]|uniref:ATP-binding protein n=1 Tax=uncultured Pelagimonas sp. TaxID=1618102 RepID=UPI002617C5BD|nr:ATP-binding protein [uncultured Pelagimonas sp.]
MILRRFLPSRLASQLLALMMGALVLAFVLTGVVMVNLQTRAGDMARVTIAAERTNELLTAMNAISPQGQADFAKAASTHTTRITVSTIPIVRETAPDIRSQALFDLIAAETESDARVAVLSRVQTAATDDPRNAGRNREVIMVSVPLADPSRWMNITVREPITLHTSADQSFLLVALTIMALLVAGVVWLFVRRLTRPLTELAQAATRAARGDLSTPISETGPVELREAAAAFNAMQSEISRFDVERTRTIAAVGHDLRTPMTSLRIRAEMIDEDALREPMITTLDQMTAMADGLITYAKDGQEEDRVPDLDLAELLGKLCRNRGVLFRATANPIVTAAPISLSRAVGNLIDNAVRHGGGEDVAVSLSQDKQDVLITVSDLGPGIPEDRMATIFEPFTRVENSRNTVTGGAGLGLSIARRIVRAHGGELLLRNRDPLGLEAVIKLRGENPSSEAQSS